MEKTLEYTWDSFLMDALTLSNLIKKSNQKFDSLLIITRGGLVLGSLLAQYLNIKVIETIGIDSYEVDTRKGIHITKQPTFVLEQTLIVDDICDTGNTLKHVKDRFKAPSVVLFYKPNTAIVKPTFYLHETSMWVKFPWEV